MDKEPTEAQIKEFWEWCGFTISGDWAYLNSPYRRGIPSVDLNNLFKYAVPKAIDKIMAGQECSSDLAYAILFKKWLQKLELDIPNHEGTLFDTIWEVING